LIYPHTHTHTIKRPQIAYIGS